MKRHLAWLVILLLAVAGVAFAAAEAEGGHGEDPHASVDLWKTVNFLILFALLYWLVKKFAGPAFKKRSAEIELGIVEANELRADSEKRAADIERRMANLDAEIADLRAAATEEMAAEGQRLKAQTEHSIARLRANAEQEITSAGKHARKELRAYSAELALNLAREKVKQRMTPEVSARLIDAFATELGRASGRAR